MKRLNILGILFLLSSLLVVSCSKENVDDNNINEGEPEVTITTEQNGLLARSTPSGSSSLGLELDCITILYSFDLVSEDGTTYTVTSDDDFFEVLEDSTLAIIDFVYPVEVQDESGETTEVADGEELGELFAQCLPNGWTDDLFPAFLLDDETSCFSAVYPLDLQNAEGEISTAENEEEYLELLVQEPMFFVFPFDLIDEDGNVYSIGDIDQLIETLISCNDVVEPGDTTWWNGDVEYIGCYQISFPFDVVLQDGTVITVEDHMQYCDLLLSGQIVDFSYPLTLIDEEGNEIVVNSAEELNELMEDCGFGGGTEVGIDIFILLEGSTSGSDCYSINYPITLTSVDFDGNTITSVVSSDEGVFEFLNTSGTGIIQLEYPVSVTMSEDQSVVELNNIEDIFNLLEECSN